MNIWSNLTLQNACSPLMENMILFHDHVMINIISIITLTFMIIINLNKMSFTYRSFMDNLFLESIWTIIPMVIFLLLALPSLTFLYLTESMDSPSMTIKSIGHQWYWSYEYPEFNNFSFDSFMLKDNSSTNNFRLLDTDNRSILPMLTQIRVLTTSNDVIHSFAIPSMGIKMDCIPGRINQSSLYFMRPGLYYGQCSEMCGVEHSFMPLVFEINSPNYFIKWMMNNTN
uniref:Cytochrome c oxidase subunit 2 n=1 Tax=Vanhornia eucnemidarum TaxID=32432 RepID=Q0H2G0_9HYME|nr:cytochrome c oxidase subunit II [Vanhornia eucnemidarum]